MMAPVGHSLNLAARPGGAAASGAGESPAHRKLRKAAQEFESILMAELWKGFGGNITSFLGDALPAASDTMNSLAVQAMSMGIAQRGGLGIAQMVVQKLAPCLNRPQIGPSQGEIKITSRG